MRKKITALMLALSMVSGAVLSAGAAGSISALIPESVTLVDGTLENGAKLIVQEADTGAYANEEVAAVVGQFNDDEDDSVKTVKDVLDTLSYDVSDNALTEYGEVVNPTLYEPLTAFFDLAIEESNGDVHYNNDGSITATLTMEAAKEKDASKLMFIQIDPETGYVYFITVDALDPESGEITATFATLGPVMLAEKSTIVVKDTSTELYTDRTVAEIVDEFEGLTGDIEQTDVIQSMIDKSETYREQYAKTYTDENGELQYETEIDEETGEVHYVQNETFEFEITDKNSSNYGETITITSSDYTSASGFADIAIPQGKDEDGNRLYSYKMAGYYDAEAQRDINNLDWYRIASEGETELASEEEIEEDWDQLVEIDPFVLTDSYVQLFNTETGEVIYIYEPTIYFTYLEDDEDETEVETETETETEELTEAETEALTEAETEAIETETTSRLNDWDIYEEDKHDDEKPIIVIDGQYYALGSFMIFMPREADNG